MFNTSGSHGFDPERQRSEDIRLGAVLKDERDLELQDLRISSGEGIRK